jgi:hypothetical protein
MIVPTIRYSQRVIGVSVSDGIDGKFEFSVVIGISRQLSVVSCALAACIDQSKPLVRN